MDVGDVRSFFMDAVSATGTLFGGLMECLTPNERKITESTAPDLSASRFWVLGRRRGATSLAVLAWSKVRPIAKSIARFAVALGVEDVIVYDVETDAEEPVKDAA